MRKRHQGAVKGSGRAITFSRGLVAVIVLPYLGTACATWRPQELSGLRDVITEKQPARIQVVTQRTGPVELQGPSISGNILSGNRVRDGVDSGEFMLIPFSDVSEARLQAFDAPKTAIRGGLLLFTVAAVVAAQAMSSWGP